MAFDDLSLYFGIGALVSTGIAAITYMFGKFSGKEDYIAYSKLQIYEILVVFLIVLAYGFFDPLLNTFIGMITPDGFAECNSLKSLPVEGVFFSPIPKEMPCYMGASIIFLDNLFYEIKYFLTQLSILQAINAIVESITIENLTAELFGTNNIYQGIPGLVGVSKIITINVKNISSFLFNSAMFIFVQKYLLLFFYYAGPTIAGVGTFLRFFPVSRKLGGLLLAMVISYWFVFPSIYALFDNLYRGSDISIEATPENYLSRDIKLVRLYFDIFADKDVLTTFSLLDKFYAAEEAALNDKFKEGFDTFIEEQESSAEAKAKEAESSFLSRVATGFRDSILTTWEFIKNLFSVFDSIAHFFNIVFDVVVKIQLFLLFQLDSQVLPSISDVPGVTLFDVMIEDLANIMIYSYLMSFIAVISWIAMVKELSPLLGGDVEIAGLTHLI